jgi:hypothetical protein
MPDRAMLKGLSNAIINCKLYRAESGDSAQRGNKGRKCNKILKYTKFPDYEIPGTIS